MTKKEILSSLQKEVAKYFSDFKVEITETAKTNRKVTNILLFPKQAGKKLVVATSKPEDYSVRIIEHFGLTQFFENVCGSRHDTTRTTKDEVISFAIERNNISDKSKILMIGDRKHDILGAKKVGIKSCGVLYGYGSLEELQTAGADFIAKDISQLRSILL